MTYSASTIAWPTFYILRHALSPPPAPGLLRYVRLSVGSITVGYVLERLGFGGEVTPPHTHTVLSNDTLLYGDWIGDGGDYL